jgi:hypothetical protein
VTRGEVVVTNVISLVVSILLTSAPAMAAQGDCGQPVSNGAQPTASDCLFILKVAVGSQTCAPVCICDTNGDGGTAATDALVCLKKAVGQAVALQCFCGVGPVGEEAQINTYTTSDQRRPSIASDADGNLIVAWESLGSAESDTDASSVHAQRFLATGDPVGTEFQVNTFTTSFQSFVSLAASGGGAFVAAWSNSGGNPSDTTNSVRARLFDSSGAPAGDDFQVNSYTPSSQTVPSVGMDGAGNFVVAWQSDGSSGSDTSGTSIQGQRYDSAGAAVGTEFQVNTYTTDGQTAPAIAVATDGRFVVVWASVKSDGLDADGSIQGQVFDSTGAALGTQFAVNTYTTGAQSAPEVDFAEESFVVVWSSYQSEGDDYKGIQGRRFGFEAPPFGPLGSEFQVNGYTTGTQGEPSVALVSRGFVVVWFSDGAGGTDTGYSIQGRYFDTVDEGLDTEFQVNTYTTGYQVFSDVAPGTNNSFAVVWDSQGSSGSDSAGFGILGQRFE